MSRVLRKASDKRVHVSLIRYLSLLELEKYWLNDSLSHWCCASSIILCHIILRSQAIGIVAAGAEFVGFRPLRFQFGYICMLLYPIPVGEFLETLLPYTSDGKLGIPLALVRSFLSRNICLSMIQQRTNPEILAVLANLVRLRQIGFKCDNPARS